jgi:two-component system response regulator QseB
VSQVVAGLQLLCVEDDAPMRRALEVSLRRLGFEVETCESWPQAADRLRHTRYDAILLDRMLPDGDALVHVREMRRKRDETPIIIYSGMSADEAALEGYEAGVNWYLFKPLSTSVVAMHVRALLAPTVARPIAVGDISLDPRARTLTLTRGPTKRLSPQAFDMLWALATRPGELVSRDDLLVKIARSEEPGSNILDVIASQLRAALGNRSWMLVTVRRYGYRLQLRQESAVAAKAHSSVR